MGLPKDISKSIIGSALIANNQPIIRGWYYDIQKDPVLSPLTTVSLHCNKKYTGTGNTGWEGVDEPEKDGYGKNPLCTSILSEDFNVQVSNHWSDFGGDPLGELWDRAKPLAPYAKTIERAIKSIAASQSTDTEEHGTISSALAKGLTWMADQGADKITDFLNRKLIVQGTRFSYYGGTDISFGALSMKFTVFPKWNPSGELETVNRQVSALYPYVIGKFVKEDFGGQIPELKEYIGWQKPPGGYSPAPQDIDKIQEGTLKLKIGAYYSIPNLLVQDAQFTFSRQMVKLPTGIKKVEGAEGEDVSVQISPLSCDISLIFRPATKFSDQALKEFVTGVGRQDDLDKLNKNMKTKLGK